MEKIEKVTSVLVPAQILQAAVLCSSKEETRYYLNGVFMHEVDGVFRAVATDGHRMFVSSCETDKDAGLPSWLKNGVIISNDKLQARLSMLAGLNKEFPLVRVSFAEGLPHVFLSDVSEEITIRQATVDGTFPDYQKIIASGVETFQSTEGEFKPVGFSGKYLKTVGDISKILGGKDGDTVSVYASSQTDAAVMTFPVWPGVVMYLMPKRVEDQLPQATSTILAPVIKLSLAGLRAQKSKRQNLLNSGVKDPAQRAELEAKIKEYEERIAALVLKSGVDDALPAPKPEAETVAPKPKAEPVKAEPKETDAVVKPAKEKVKVKAEPKKEAEAKPDPKPEPKVEAKPEPKPEPAKPEPAKIEAKGKRSFEDWKRLLDQQVTKMVGLSADDLPDCDYSGWFEDGMSAMDAAKKAIREAEHA